MLSHLSKLRGIALDLLFPQRCIGCGEEGMLICHACRKSLIRIMPPICPLCGRPQPSGIVCSHCVSRRTGIDGIRSPFRFDGLMRQAVHQFKYKNLRSFSGLMAAMLRDYLQQNPLPSEVLVPVPLHPRRLRERGYNQSELLARELSRLTGIPLNCNFFRRTRYLSPQALTDFVEERLENVYQAFSCCNSALQGKQVLLIDDVSTSGATLDSCALTLKSAGAVSVWGLVLAREI